MNWKGTYFVRKSSGDEWEDITTKFKGVAVLKLEGLLERGDSVNVYTAQWVDEQEEDFLVAGDSVIRKNVDITLTFLVKQRYSPYAINVQTVHDTFVDYMTSGKLYLKTSYLGGLYVKCVCTKAYKPTTVKLQRGSDSYIMGTITLHALDKPTTNA